MIQAITETNFSTFISTEDNRIDTSVASTQIRFLVKFINDMDGSVDYAYPIIDITDRATSMRFIYTTPTPDMFSGQVKLLPAGYWKYEVYEVSWTGTVTVSSGNAPATENDVLTPPSSSKGIVKGLVTKGKMYLAEKDGTEQVQYTQYPEKSGTNYIYYGQ